MSEDLYEIYEGTDPYLFISYSHQDSDQVEPLIHGLQDMGYRLWYDTGIAVGSRWPDTIAEHLMESNCIVAFISENAVASDYCQEELFFAMELHKPIVAVYLAETMLPPGLRMRLSARQAIYRYKFSNDLDFLVKLDKERLVRASKSIPKDPSHHPTVHNTLSSSTKENLNPYLNDYLKLEHDYPDPLFMQAGDLAINLKTFTYRDLVTALGSSNYANICLKKMRELRLIGEIGYNRYKSLIDPNIWEDLKKQLANS